MATLLTELKRILDLKNPEDEANKKLAHTYMFVNGELGFIEGFEYPRHARVSYRKNKDVLVLIEALEVYLPEVGLYPIDTGTAVLLTRTAKKPWEHPPANEAKLKSK